MKLHLNRPLVVFDLETTGLNIARDRIIQISWIKVMPSGEEYTGNSYVNPECEISEEVILLTGITNEMVADAPTFKTLAPRIITEFTGCDFAGFNSNKFDVPLLVEEMLRAGCDISLFEKAHYIDVQNIYHKKERRNLAAAYRFYVNPGGFANAHSSDADTRATWEVLQAQLERYDDLQPNVKDLEEFSRMNNFAEMTGTFIYDNEGRVCFNFGKHKGCPVEEVLRTEPTYYAWMMNGEFPQQAKKLLTHIKFGMMKR